MFGFVSGYLGGRKALSRATRAAAQSEIGGLNAAFSPDPVADLTEKMERMTLIVEGLWELLSQHGHTDEELEAVVSRLHLQATRTVACPECGSMISGSPRCQICGASSGIEPPALGP